MPIVTMPICSAEAQLPTSVAARNRGVPRILQTDQKAAAPDRVANYTALPISQTKRFARRSLRREDDGHSFHKDRDTWRQACSRQFRVRVVFRLRSIQRNSPSENIRPGCGLTLLSFLHIRGFR